MGYILLMITICSTLLLIISLENVHGIRTGGRSGSVSSRNTGSRWGGSGSSRNTGGSWGSGSSRNTGGSWGSGSSVRNPGSSWGSGSSRNTGGSSGGRTSYGSSNPSGYRVPTGTMGRSSFSHGAPVRPRIRAPPVSYNKPTKVVYNTRINNYGPSYGGSSGMRFLEGYYLGSIMGRMNHGYRYGYGPSSYIYYYVPYRARYPSYYTTPAPGVTQKIPETPTKSVDLCTLARWNRELPFTELSNMVIDSLINDTASGNSTVEKSKFIYDLFKTATDSYFAYDNSHDTFNITPGTDLTNCGFSTTSNFDPVSPGGSVEEPIMTSARWMIQTYSNISTHENAKAALQDLVDAAKACLSKPAGDGIALTNTEAIPCLDYTITPEQLLRLNEPGSIFGNEEICRQHLVKDKDKCVTSSCTLDHLEELIIFARGNYLCQGNSASGYAANKGIMIIALFLSILMFIAAT